jgi:predicted NAD/FAD-binding protein
VVVVGSGIAGLSTAWHLRHAASVTVLESAPRLGGHTHTRQVSLEGKSRPVDTGFIVFNHRTYPEFRPWLETLGVATTPTEMSFSVSVDKGVFEWSGSNLDTVFAQRRNTISPRFWGMLSEIVRFNRQAPRDCQLIDAGRMPAMSLGDYLLERRYGAMFQQAYLLPMAGAIWSCPPETMRGYPFASFVHFCVNHGLLQLVNRPQWYSLTHGSSSYITRLQEIISREGFEITLRTGHEVAATRLTTDTSSPSIRQSLRVEGVDRSANTPFAFSADAVVLACHADQAAGLLDPGLCPQTLAALRKIRFQPNTAYLHTDTALMPRRRRAWAAWNYLSRGPLSTQTESAVSVTYWMNRLQSLDFQTPVLVSLNPLWAPDPQKTLEVNHYAHPIFDEAAVEAQSALARISGEGRHWVAGAWMGYGFHEDGFRSGRQAAESVVAALGLPSAQSSAPLAAWAA